MGVSAALFGSAATSATATAAATAATTGLIGAGGAFSFGTALSTFGTLASATGAISGGIQSREQARNQAIIQQQQADRERQISSRQEASFRRQQSNLLASGRALGRTDPSALLLARNTAGEIEFQAQNIRSGGQVSEQRLRQQSAITRARGQQQFTGGLARGGSLLLERAGERFL